MKIRHATDRHLELLKPAFQLETLINPLAGANLLLLTGDIHSRTPVFADAQPNFLCLPEIANV